MTYNPSQTEEFSAKDAGKVVLYAKKVAAAREAFPVLQHELSPAYAPAASSTAGGLALSSATAAVTLGTGTCVVVDVSAAGGLLAVGGDSAVNAATHSGIILTPGSTVYRMSATNLNQIWVAGASGTRASYVAYN